MNTKSEITKSKTKKTKATSAVGKLHDFFEEHPDELIDAATLSSVAGTRDWTRAIRSVRADYGFNIQYIYKCGEKPDGYIYKTK